MAKFTPDYETYKASDEYKKQQEKLNKLQDEEEYNADKDPDGYEMYKQLVSIPKVSPFQIALTIYCTI